jgi:hypothetical protein
MYQMIKRIFDIITFPFYFIYRLVSFPFKLIKIILDDKIDKQRNRKNALLTKTSQNELIDIGHYLFYEFFSEYKTFINSYLKDKKAFFSENKDLLSNYDNFEMDKLRPLEAIYIFGDSKQKLYFTDWRGEENHREIEDFLEDNLQLNNDWRNVNELRKGVEEVKQKDEEFTIELLKTIDKDLEALNKRLVFLDLDWDGYVYTVVDQITYKTITDKFGTLFHGTENLRT